jgi:hypothetical protein
MLGERGLRSHVVSWFATHGEQSLDGCIVSNMFCHLPGSTADQSPADWPPPPAGTYWPAELAEAMNELRVSPHDLDPDEVIRLFVPEAHTVDQQKDKRLWVLAEKLAEAFSAHAAATHLMETDPDWNFTAVYYRAIDEISHMFMPYHPPRMEGIPEADFELYKQVVTGLYRLHDLFLCRLMQLAGPETAIVLVSDHGFHSDHLRPKFTPRVPAGITVWHRPQGVFIASGPGFKRDELVYGGRLLDVAPTILHWFGLPVGADMEGRVLEEVFEAPRRPVETVPTWETGVGLSQERKSLGAGADKALLEQFVALGYIDEIPDDPGQAAAATNRENDWNIARACMYGTRYAEALPLLEWEMVPATKSGQDASFSIFGGWHLFRASGAPDGSIHPLSPAGRPGRSPIEGQRQDGRTGGVEQRLRAIRGVFRVHCDQEKKDDRRHARQRQTGEHDAPGIPLHDKTPRLCIEL